MKSNKFSLVLAAALLAAGCVSQQTYNTEVQKADSLTALNQKLSAELGTDQAQITQLQNQLKVTLVNEVLFPEGGWTLSSKSEAALGKIAPTLAGLKGQQILVEGFTDNEPIGPALKARFPSNLELSSNNLSAQGFGESRPVASNSTPEGRAKNRRVEIVIAAASRP